jgi:Family of unknown function (DUF6459)
MTTSAPQWPGQDGMHEGMRAEAEEDTSAPPAFVRGPVPARRSTAPVAGPGRTDGGADGGAEAAGRRREDPTATGDQPGGRPPLRAVPDKDPRRRRLVPTPSTAIRAAPPAPRPGAQVPGASAQVPKPKAQVPALGQAGSVGTAGSVGQERTASGRRNRFVVVRDPTERELWAARRRARANLPAPAAVTRDIALALLEVEAGCRSAAQLERIFSPELWESLQHRIGRRGGPLPSGRSLISVRCQEDTPGLADTVAVVQRGDVVRPVALRLDAGCGRWRVTELRWWRNETDTATTPRRDGGGS